MFQSDTQPLVNFARTLSITIFTPLYAINTVNLENNKGFGTNNTIFNYFKVKYLIFPFFSQVNSAISLCMSHKCKKQLHKKNKNNMRIVYKTKILTTASRVLSDSIELQESVN